MKEGVKGWECRTYEGDQNVQTIVVRKSERKISWGRPKHI